MYIRFTSLPKVLFVPTLQAAQGISVQDQVWVDSIEEKHRLSQTCTDKFSFCHCWKESNGTTIFTVLDVVSDLEGIQTAQKDVHQQCASSIHVICGTLIFMNLDSCRSSQCTVFWTGIFNYTGFLFSSLTLVALPFLSKSLHSVYSCGRQEEQTHLNISDYDKMSF